MNAATYVGLVVFASLFVISGFNHIRNHTGTSGYTTNVLPSSLAPLGYLGGWPTGVFLVVAGVASGFGYAAGLYAVTGFLAVATVLFHRAELLKLDPGALKGVALAGAALALAQLVVR